MRKKVGKVPSIHKSLKIWTKNEHIYRFAVGTVEKSTGHSYIFFIADEVIVIPPLFIPFWPCREQGLFLYHVSINKLIWSMHMVIYRRICTSTCHTIFNMMNIGSSTDCKWCLCDGSRNSCYGAEDGKDGRTVNSSFLLS